MVGGVYSMIMLFYSIKRKVIYNVKRTWVYGKIKVTENELDELMAVIQEVWPEAFVPIIGQNKWITCWKLISQKQIQKNWQKVCPTFIKSEEKTVGYTAYEEINGKFI